MPAGIAYFLAMDLDFDTAVSELSRLGKDFHGRGWVLGTSGNFSAVLARDPLRVAITASGADKGDLGTEHFLAIDGAGRPERRNGARPSDEHALHLELATTQHAGAVLHTHSVWGTVLSDLHAHSGGLAIEGYEMQKGLRGVVTHEQREWLPILDNDQDIPALAGRVRAALAAHPQAHGFLLRRHGLYTWGADIREARRHVEILEFLLEAVGRSQWRS